MLYALIRERISGDGTAITAKMMISRSPHIVRRRKFPVRVLSAGVLNTLLPRQTIANARPVRSTTAGQITQANQPTSNKHTRQIANFYKFMRIRQQTRMKHKDNHFTPMAARGKNNLLEQELTYWGIQLGTGTLLRTKLRQLREGTGSGFQSLSSRQLGNRVIDTRRNP